MRLLAIVPPLLLASACSPEPEDTSPGDTDADADTDADTDTGDPHGVGLTGHKGEVLVDPLSWLGVESWYFTADKGMGDDLCLVTWDSTSTAVRSDCGQCDWAFDVVWTSPRVVIDEAPGCAALLGASPEVVAALDGTVASYGYVAEYYGHAEMLMAWTEKGGWAPTAYAFYDEGSGTLRFDRQEGYVEY